MAFYSFGISNAHNESFPTIDDKNYGKKSAH